MSLLLAANGSAVEALETNTRLLIVVPEAAPFTLITRVKVAVDENGG